MSELPSFTKMMIELLASQEGRGYQTRELAARIIVADVRLSWWYSVVGKLSSGDSSEEDLELLDSFLGQHEELFNSYNAQKRGEISADELTVAMRDVVRRVEFLLGTLPRAPWLDNA
ncbi:hypothetical protein [Saccharothrix sp. ST-888]|uniref:hypothetical protein n=1 Tax=Saccharothrix sp. ST-888 TaxID=1427391 RepID=UPI0005ECFEF7|nr:hypothetical protein [Saccharothrix sp. ST-888]KJK58197.1 hypothetical protein UK12_11865 [Saccharothrix sp. ST-888]